MEYTIQELFRRVIVQLDNLPANRGNTLIMNMVVIRIIWIYKWGHIGGNYHFVAWVLWTRFFFRFQTLRWRILLIVLILSFLAHRWLYLLLKLILMETARCRGLGIQRRQLLITINIMMITTHTALKLAFDFVSVSLSIHLKTMIRRRGEVIFPNYL